MNKFFIKLTCLVIVCSASRSQAQEVDLLENRQTGLLTTGPGILQAHGHDAATDDVHVDQIDRVEVDFFDVVDHLVLLSDGLEVVLVDELDEIWDLVVDELFGVGDRVPHNQILSNRLHEEIIWVALLKGAK